MALHSETLDARPPEPKVDTVYFIHCDDESISGAWEYRGAEGWVRCTLARLRALARGAA